MLSESASQDSWEEYLRSALIELEHTNRKRSQHVTLHQSGATIQRDGRLLVNFGGNDYLGLRNHPHVVAAATQAIADCGLGSGASPAVTGYSFEQQALESELADFCHLPAALVFSSGFAGNLATISSLVGPQDAIFSDALNHASLIDGCRLTKARRIVYPHGDVTALEQQLRDSRLQFNRVLIVTESIFSMDGDAAPLSALSDLAQRFDCGLIVDEAHATGVYGPTGAGLLEELALDQSVFAKLGTLSKAIGCQGGFLSGSTSLIEYVLNRGRSYMYSTALPTSTLAAAVASVKQIRSMHTERAALRIAASDLRTRLIAGGWQVCGADSPIIPVILGTEDAALTMSTRLQAAGFFVPAHGCANRWTRRCDQRLQVVTKYQLRTRREGDTAKTIKSLFVA